MAPVYNLVEASAQIEIEAAEDSRLQDGTNCDD